MKMRTLKGTSFLCTMAFAAATVLPSVALAEQVSLRSQDGSVNINGDLVSFEDNFYLVSTALGELRLSAERVSCVGEACPTFAEVTPDVTFAGSGTVGNGVMPLLLEGYAGFLDGESTFVATGRANETVASLVGDSGFGEDIGTFLVGSTSSSDAFRALQRKDAEIGMTTRRIRPAEARTLATAGAGDMTSSGQEHIVAIDSIVVITHPENPVKSIGLDDLADIYTGRKTNWSQLGGPDLPIELSSVRKTPAHVTFSLIASLALPHGFSLARWLLSITTKWPAWCRAILDPSDTPVSPFSAAPKR